MLMIEYLEQWMQAFVVPFRAANTVGCYRRAMAALPEQLMHTDLAAVSGLQLQAAINQKAARYPRAGQLVFAMLHAALSQAVKLGMIPSSPMTACIKPRHQARKAVVLNPDQLHRYLDAARMSDAWPLLLLISTCGLRRSEALGLTWASIDLGEGQLCINQQRLRTPGQYTAQPLKSRSSRRVLTLPPQLMDELRPLRGLPAAWVVDMTPEALAKAHQAAVKAAWVPKVTLHGLRHSMATICAADGMPIKQLQAVLGHAHYQLTADTYAGHVAAASGAAALARMAASVL